MKNVVTSNQLGTLPAVTVIDNRNREVELEFCCDAERLGEYTLGDDVRGRNFGYAVELLRTGDNKLLIVDASGEAIVYKVINDWFPSINWQEAMPAEGVFYTIEASEEVTEQPDEEKTVCLGWAIRAKETYGGYGERYDTVWLTIFDTDLRMGTRDEKVVFVNKDAATCQIKQMRRDNFGDGRFNNFKLVRMFKRV